MNKTERKRIYDLESRLVARGFTYDEVHTMIKASKALSRWCERECNGEIEREGNTGRPLHVIQRHYGPAMPPELAYYPIRDMESAAKRKIDAIIANHPGWAWYYQGDPRGCAVYLYRLDDEHLSSYSIDSIYSSIGIAIY